MLNPKAMPYQLTTFKRIVFSDIWASESTVLAILILELA